MTAHPRAVAIRLTMKRRRKPEQIVAAGTSQQRPVLRACGVPEVCLACELQ